LARTLRRRQIARMSEGREADVGGYTDGIGSHRYNQTLRWLREEAARRYLIERAQALNRLSFIGFGVELTAVDRNLPMARSRDRQAAILNLRPVQ
jgi:outer membrane protein OmpA-like peptidoglycan-associated protein